MPSPKNHFQIAAIMLLGFAASSAGLKAEIDLESSFSKDVRPFVESYCLDCHDNDTRKADLDLSAFKTAHAVAKDYPHWELVLERLRNGDMPPQKSKHQPSFEVRASVIGWIEQLRSQEARRTAGDPGPVLARRLSNAEYDYTIRDLTGVDLRPTQAFPVDPANQAGFDNSGESLAMSPALVKKYLQAAREISEHLALEPDGFTFAENPVIADTDRDKWAVFRIVNFYRKQPTDYADYFQAAWLFENRASLGKSNLSLDDFARDAKVSPKYLKLIHSTMTGESEGVGPIAKLQSMWDALPEPRPGTNDAIRKSCVEMRDYLVRIRESIVPAVPNLKAPPIHDGSQTFVMWKNRQMASNRRRFDPAALESSNSLANSDTGDIQSAESKAKPANRRRPNRHVQAPTPEIVQKGGFSLAPTLVTKESSATSQMAVKRMKHDPELMVPNDPAERARYESAFARFADIFPDAFYITERARVYLDAKQEQANSGRLLSAGLHSMTGYFRDDQPLYDLILDEAGRKELDALWDQFNFISLVPQRMHTSLLWFERTDSGYLRDPEFDPYRPEDKSVTSQEKIHKLAELYLAKAKRNNASELAQHAIQEHFEIVATNIARVESLRAAAEPKHLDALEKFAERAYRHPLTGAERDDLRAFYKEARTDNGGDHEEAMRDCIARLLVSPRFLFRMDLIEAAGSDAPKKEIPGSTRDERIIVEPLSDYALASRLSYFLWASMPDPELLELAVEGKLHQPEVLEREARRMLKDERVRDFATEFAGNWLDFRRFEQHNSVDRQRFPMFDNELRSAMFEEPVRFFVDVAQHDRSVLDFVYARDTFVNAPLAKHYGIIPAPPGTNTWVHVENAAEYGRGGVLPMAAFLTANSPGLRTSPVKRGNWVVKRVLGERIPPPPAIVPELPKDEKAMGTHTLRETLAMHRDRAGCRECHARFDSFGLVFESYGPVGEKRELDLGGRPVDTHAEFPGGSQGDGLEGLRKYIHEHRETDFVDNLCRKMLAYALGRTLILGDEPLVQQMRERLVADHYHFSSLIETVVTSQQFLNKRGDRNLAKN